MILLIKLSDIAWYSNKWLNKVLSDRFWEMGYYDIILHFRSRKPVEHKALEQE